MDGQQFDRLMLRLGQVTSRRRAGGLLAALGLGALLHGPRESVAKKKKKKKKPKACKGGAVKCGNICVNIKSNALHCGGCGNRCGNNNACVDGKCQGGCPGSQILCVGLCVDPSDNDDHCGDCGVKCQGDLTCIDGQCGCAEGAKCGNQCVDTQSDPDHCGGCNDPCDSGETCVGGQCNPSGCGPNRIDCGGGLCIPDTDDACCNAADCGGSGQPTYGIHCNTNTHRCECNIAGHGICQRFANTSGICGPCCPGATVEQPCGPGDQICLSPTINGCGCPNGTEVCPYHHDVCVGDPGNDPRCCALGPAENFGPCPAGSGCWCGLCRRGCQPSPQGTQGCNPTPGLQCGPSCTECPQDAPYCCESGPGEAACSSDRYCGG